MTPRLTVVVPIYNVEDYLDDCLRSLAGQTMADSEIVMVDDGSTDGSARIARRFAEADGRFRLVEQENAGLGAARNTGVRYARGEFLTFVDSDDTVPDDAYERMLAALDASGSDFATGNVLRLGPGGALTQAPMFRKPMATERSGTRLTRDWVLLGDRIACNKVFRKSFWDRHSFVFPSGVLYEDIAVVLPAYFLASGVDVLSAPVYHWRTRDGSITAKRAVPKGIRDRVTAVSSVAGFLTGRATTDTGSGTDWADALRRYHQHVLSGDLWLFIEALPDGDAEFHAAFLDHANAFAATVHQSVFDALPLHLRVKWHLIRERRMPELLALLAHEKADPGAFGVRGLRRSRAEYPVLTGGLPRAVATLRPKELPVTSHLTEAVWREGRLHLKGYAYVRNVPADARRKSVKAAWLRTGKRRVLPLRTRTVRMSAATYESKQGLHVYDWAGFETVVDPRRLVRAQGSGGSVRTVWKLEMGVFGAGRLRRAPLRLTGSAAAPAVPAVHYVDDTTRVVPALSGNKLELRVEPVRALLTGHAPVGGGALRIEGLLHPTGTPPTVLAVQNWYTKDVHEAELSLGEGTFTADVPLTVFGDPTARRQATVPWGVHLVRPDGSRFAVAARAAIRPGHYALGDGREVYVTANAAGDLVLSDQTEQPVVDTVDWTADGELFLTGSRPAPGRAELVLRHSGHHEENVFAVDTLADGRFRMTLLPAAVEGLHGVRQLAEGRWLLYVREPGESDPERYTAVRVQPSRHQTLPLVRNLDGREFTLDRRHQDMLQLHSGSALPEQDRGAYRQQRLRGLYATARATAGPLRDAVLYSSFDGRQYSDSPRALHEELVRRRAPVEHLWVVRDRQVTLPAGVRAVELHSADWYDALARSRCVVTNTHLPEWFERAEGQYVAQTWHGTPLKRIGRDLSGSAHADERYIATLPRRSAQWSVLVSPNGFSTPIMRRAFGYEGTVLESGYPRNDLLHAPDRGKVADALREALEIPGDKRVILYAPTWREDQPKKGGRYGLDLRLDLAQAAEELAQDHVLLVRRHYLVGGTVPGAGRGAADFVRDVSRHPDVAELMLISDALVTDYSSLMFDFAQTGRPMYFHAYDLEHYRDTLRGFYFDFESAAPGPVVTDTAALVAALRAPGSRVPTAAYERFRETFCDLDDGTAAARLADLMPVGGGA
ncbi:bifunctional glycosyltransferase family 2 protein/CDP-glycerol:glycerophosphate glycerophosphotransferase [Streptomyces sp. NBC_01725]|uniref:bifunctional glycosyltransferase/CDP-glycerol:glycerophosphate glycerophosphotransferase n=1 Tax=Streptomyces sp. NBC_01725 TaxID=2975923 RepID=UPI002E29ADC9|nr:bifunctional glycosyltransferase family 2 protein/CDP-glycerol:glycerophosphate glycerophosphotransferase [Streptomyces sp. NBC_01725]